MQVLPHDAKAVVVQLEDNGPWIEAVFDRTSMTFTPQGSRPITASDVVAWNPIET